MLRNHKSFNVFLWTIQVLLALLFLFAGGMKLILPLAALNQGPIELPGWFLRGIGVLEVLGGLGVFLPAALGIRRQLVPVAAVGLVGIMIGATVLTALTGPLLPSLFPLSVGALALTIGLGRRRYLSAGPLHQAVIGNLVSVHA